MHCFRMINYLLLTKFLILAETAAITYLTIIKRALSPSNLVSDLSAVVRISRLTG